jgi:hypothetical protein
MLSVATVANTPVSGAAFTSVNEDVDGTGHCKNGNPNNNCNIYDGKQYVWLNGGPAAAALGNGTYFFAVLVPSQQANPNDAATIPDDGTGTPKNLSDDFDSYQNRMFTVSNGTILYGGTHALANNKIRLDPYSDTLNNGGVYILAICSLADANSANGSPGVNASDCKYDAFKVDTTVNPRPPALALTITKGADGAYDTTYAWTIDKSVNKTIVKQVGGSVTFSYTIQVTRDSGTDSNFKVTGTISVFNPNVDADNVTLPVDIDGVTDHLSDNTVCTVTNGGAQTLTAAKTDFPYSCDLSAVPSVAVSNVVKVTWPEQILADGNLLLEDSAEFTFLSIGFTQSLIDECVNVTDTVGGPWNDVCGTKSLTYDRTIDVKPGCISYDNTATFTTNDSGTQGSDSQTVTVCGPAQTGALTMGFWKGPNGNGLIGTYCVNGSNSLATYLAGLAAGSGPFASAAGKSCSQLVTYVNGILTAASASDMNKMLKAQMLATALDVWFSGPGWTSTTVGKVKPPSTFLAHNSLGTFNMDTTAVCPMVDNTTTGTATCKNNTPSTDAVASGALPSSPMAMQAILDFAATTPAPFSAGVWYGGDRTKQEILKNVFDQFNNQLAFGSF